MKKVLTFAVALVFCAAVGLAHGHGGGTAATITKVDMAAKSMVVKTVDGKEMTIYWNDTTRLRGGDLKEGETVHFRSSEKDGKTWATSVYVGAKPKKATS
jgi:Cu/Ag efflux protein CusF